MSEDTTDSDGQPDYRFVLANERTFLAYLRTALALNGAALAIDQLLEASRTVRLLLGLLCAALGLLVSVASYRRWQVYDRAIRAGTAMPLPRFFPVLAAGLLGLSVAAMIVLVA